VGVSGILFLRGWRTLGVFLGKEGDAGAVAPAHGAFPADERSFLQAAKCPVDLDWGEAGLLGQLAKRCDERPFLVFKLKEIPDLVAGVGQMVKNVRSAKDSRLDSRLGAAYYSSRWQKLSLPGGEVVPGPSPDLGLFSLFTDLSPPKLT